MSMPDPQESKTERLEARMTPRQKRLFQRAADLHGQSLTEFTLTHLQEAAERVIRECEMIELTARDSLVLVDSLLNPPEPTQRQLQAAQRYKQRMS